MVDPNPDEADGAADIHLAGMAGEILPSLLDGLDLASNP